MFTDSVARTLHVIVSVIILSSRCATMDETPIDCTKEERNAAAKTNGVGETDFGDARFGHDCCFHTGDDGTAASIRESITSQGLAYR
jgi:hypothetical protein